MFRIKKLTRLFSITKNIINSSHCHETILYTSQLISKTTAVTFGPCGRNVVIQNKPHKPRITKDGVTVVRHLQFKDRLQDAIATLIKQSVGSTNKFAGDGTTTSIILINALVTQGFKRLAIGDSRISLKKGLQIGKNICLDYIEAVAKKIQKEQQFIKVAMISTNKNEKISKIVCQAVSKAQAITIEKSQSVETYIEYFEGMKIVRGIPNQLLKNQGNKIIYNYPLIVTSKKQLKSVKQIVSILQFAKKAKKQLVIFAENISQSVKSMLIYNNQKEIIQVCFIQIPPYGEKAKNYCSQISYKTGSYLFDEFSESIEQFNWNHFGKALKVQIDQFQTLIMSTNNLKNDINAIIKIGGNTQEVLLQNYDKMVDALNSVQNAKKYGVVAGGGTTFWRLSQLLSSYQGQHSQGVKLLAQGLKYPRRLLFTEQYMHRINQGQGWNSFDIRTKKVVNMLDEGIFDSVSVAKSVIIDAISLSSLLIDIEVSIVRSHENIDNQFDQNMHSSNKI